MSQTLAEIKSLLAASGLRPKHRLGQNFLHDHNKLDQIIAASGVTPGDVVLEVGPGTGALTERLLAGGASVVAVEIDADLCAILRQRIGNDTDHWRLIHADVMAGKHAINPDVITVVQAASRTPQAECPAPPTAERKTQDAERTTLIANLPYNIASPLLATLACDHPTMVRATVMVQREVADRMTAPPACPDRKRSGKDYGPLSVILQAMFDVRRVMTLAPGCFWPQPKIESAVVQLTRRERPLADDPHRLRAVLHRLFTQRRKQIGTILGRDTPLPAGVEPTMRAEQLTVEQFVVLSQAEA